MAMTTFGLSNLPRANNKTGRELIANAIVNVTDSGQRGIIVVMRLP
jgi:hypothetical protein